MMSSIELRRIVDCLEHDWEKKYDPKQVIKNIINDSYEDFLGKKSKRMPMRQNYSATPTVHDGVKLKEVTKKIDDHIFIQNRNLYNLYKDIDVNKDGHVCINDLSKYLQNRTNLSRPEVETFLSSLDKPPNQPFSFQEFHSKIYPGFSQKENYNPGAKLTNVIGIKSIDPNKQRDEYKKNIDFIENVRKSYKVSGIHDNCKLISLFL